MSKRVYLLLTVVLLAAQARALDPARPASSYLRTNFTLEDGLPSNNVNAIVQSQNGFLWIGTDRGLARFNGRRFAPIYFRGPQSSPQGVVRSLALAPNGDLWVGTGTGLVRIPKDGLDVFDRSQVSFHHPGAGMSNEINCLHFNRDGGLWIGTNLGLFRSEGAGFKLVLARVSISRLEESLRGHMLVTTSQGPFELNHDQVIEHSELSNQLGIKADDVFHFFEDRGGVRWFCTHQGLFRQSADKVTRIRTPNNHANPAFRIIEDAQANLWVFTDTGLFRVSSNSLEPLAPHFNAASAYTDRDGVLWIGRKGDGLVRFKEGAIRMIKPLDVQASTSPMTVFADRESRLWVGNSCGGLSLFDGKGFKTYAEKDGLMNSCVFALAQDTQGDLWVGTWGGGLFRFSQGKFTQFGMREGLPGNIVRAIVSAPDNSIWIATDDGLSHLQNGRFRNFTTADGLSSNRVINVFRDRRGVIWAATREGVNRMSAGRFQSIASTPNIFDNPYVGFAEDSSGRLFALSAPKGLSLIKDRIVSVDPDIELLSMLEVAGKDFWFAGSNGIFRLPESEIVSSFQEQGRPFDFDRFGRADGLTSPQCSMGVPNMTTTADGKLWVATTQGVASLNVAQLQRTNRAASPYLDEVTIGRTKMQADRKLTIPPGTHHMELHFDSIELASPEKIRFQYRLDDVDSSWLDADSTQTAVYTSVPLGAHLFHVRASNRDGIWNQTGIDFEVTQQPYFFQTPLFKTLVIGFAALALIWLYRLRLQYLARDIQARLQERVAERERIARDLHDTLLQSFHGLILRFQAAQNLLPQRPVEAREALECAIDLAAEAITEGRDAVQELRNSHIHSNDLVQTLTALGEEIGADHANGDAGKAQAVFRVLVEGKPRQVNAALQDDLYRIIREALRNAFRHARAREIEIDIRFDGRMLRLRVRDDGIGMDPNLIAQGGRERHWGLPGMRERAKTMGGHLDLWSELGQGTEVEVTIPAALAYRKAAWREKESAASAAKGGGG